MKFISLRINRSHRRKQLETPCPAPREPSSRPTIALHHIHTYTELRHQIHDDLRAQHPDWVQADGESPICDSYESRLMELLDPSTPIGSTQSSASPHHAIA